MSRFQERLAALGFSTYEDYLASPHWSDFKRRYWESPRPKTCAVCGLRGIELHHHNYDRLGHERLDDVTPLCRPHHEAVHEWLKTSGKVFVRYTPEAITALIPVVGVRHLCERCGNMAVKGKRHCRPCKRRGRPPKVVKRCHFCAMRVPNRTETPVCKKCSPSRPWTGRKE